MRFRSSTKKNIGILFFLIILVSMYYFRSEVAPFIENQKKFVIENIEHNIQRPHGGASDLNFPHVAGVEVNLKDGSFEKLEKHPPNQQPMPSFNKSSERDPSAYEPVLNWRENGNMEPILEARTGPGEFGARVASLPENRAKEIDTIKEYGFNMVNSDRISLDRYPKDLRHKECRHWNYNKDLPTVSVILVFHNEGWSTFIRTVHSVIQMTPKHLLAEIILIDDHSNKEPLGQHLQDYIKRWDGLVVLHRNERREGLIRARSIGAEKAKKGEILIYLDAHCEVGLNWLPPLITPIAINPKACTVPLIDVINGRDYTFTQQAGGDWDGFARGAWDWSMLWKRVPLTKQEKERRKYTTEPYRSPAMAGGLFAINREYFFKIGLYDPGLEIWGGENFEISYKIWMCGGELLFVPCSRVGHVYRLEGWNGNPPPDYVPANPSLRNYIRVVEVWWDDYKEYFYASRPETINMPYGNIDAQVKFRQDNHCKSFQWFMENIAYDIPEHYPIPPKNKKWGEIRAVGTDQCLDSMGHKNQNGPIETGYCHRLGGNQLFRLSEANQLAQYDQCMTYTNWKITLVHCDTTQNREWDFVENQIKHLKSNKCIERGELVHKIFLADCKPSNKLQQWEINQVQS